MKPVKFWGTLIWGCTRTAPLDRAVASIVDVPFFEEPKCVYNQIWAAVARPLMRNRQ